MMISSWVLDARLEDQRFAEAYAAVSPQCRSRLKTAMARQDVLCRAIASRSTQSTSVLQAGFVVSEREHPVSDALVVLDRSTSPAALIAALMPVLNAGIGTVVVAYAVEQTQAIPDGLLTALELMGQELVVELSPDRVLALVQEWERDEHPRLVMALGETGMWGTPGPLSYGGCRFWRAPAEGEIAVYLEGAGSDVDLDMLAFARPYSSFLVAGNCPESLPSGFRRVGNDISDLPTGENIICFAPDCWAEKIFGSYCCVFGPGHEACHVWPDLGAEWFRVRSTAWYSPIVRQTEEL
ncbi:hypothetical protein SAMN02745704_01316 [Paucidesulfovibrio gracilis DSM 16080]|uniref:Uncharacterized protein n=1 Tax=Paucidesulfovibrio gracilis DSM 16080 TaxID=1121449 RepID=A0A1T4WSC5_9BACT|nr:hypothetical protein [Paucidesulfovibrio gracilis]SKA80224.1 hypothetical protein SAMN02745704_01316 [Paucidesulfovibrio gracilis DSM 16080]